MMWSYALIQIVCISSSAEKLAYEHLCSTCEGHSLYENAGSVQKEQQYNSDLLAKVWMDDVSLSLLFFF